MSKVRVICNLPTPLIIFTAPVVHSAYDDAHHELPPLNLELRGEGAVNEVELATLEYHMKRIGGVKFERAKDTFVVSVDDPKADRANRERLKAEMQALDMLPRARPRSTPRKAADSKPAARPSKPASIPSVSIDDIFHR